uniref:PDZ and LIM domain protein Zasp n=1 Tax=Syphacia muris TaxID=451379 RepID=A0A158R5A3_9BILA
MVQAEVVTVRMSRGNVETPWGFDIVPPIQISNVIANSLADRAGLLSGDTLVELEGYEKPDYQLAKQLLAKAEHKIELIVHRDIAQGTRIWKPSVSDNAEYSRFQHSVHNVPTTETQNQSRIPPPPPPPPTAAAAAAARSAGPVKVSLEHQPQGEVNIPGFNVKAQPYGARQEVKHLQYNSPMPIYSPQSAAEQYLQQTGGLFGTDPNVAKMTEVPAYLRSETLRLIQEDEARKEMSKEGFYSTPLQSTQQDSTNANNTETPASAPMCYLCGRNIQGVMCRAFDHYLHPDCFNCATCGTSLKNQGHHFINGKFYCSVHGRQFETRNTLPTSSVHTGLNVRNSPVAASPRRNQESNVRAFYQPEVMARRPLSISPTPWKTQSPISPSNRGVPHSAVQYGQDMKTGSYLSQPITTTIGKFH